MSTEKEEDDERKMTGKLKDENEPDMMRSDVDSEAAQDTVEPEAELETKSKKRKSESASPPHEDDVATKKRKTNLWDDCYADLVEYQCVRGHCNVSHGDDPHLAEWVSAQRKRQRGSDTQVACVPLQPYQIEQLNAIGFVWDEPDQAETGETSLEPRGDGQGASSTGDEPTGEGVIQVDGSEPKRHPMRQQYDAKWMKMYELLSEFKRVHGDCLVGRDHKKLGNWVYAQRSQNRAGTLYSDRKKLLDDIGFCWQPPRNDSPKQAEHAKWRQTYELLSKFKREHGDCLVQRDHELLWTWVQTQRNLYRHKNLQSDRRKLLDDIGFCWDPVSRKQAEHDKWMQKYELLSKFKQEHGDCVVPRDRKILLSWVVTQRHMFRRGKLQSDRKKLLDDIGFCWDPDNRKQAEHDKWMQKYELLSKFKREHGNCLVNTDHKILGRWVAAQRRRNREGSLDGDRKKLLDDIGFCWFPTRKGRGVQKGKGIQKGKGSQKGKGIQAQNAISWTQKYELLSEFKRVHGDCFVSQNHKILGGWVKRHREKNREGRLDNDRKKLLDDIGFCWHPVSRKQAEHDKWMQKYELLLEFKREHGDCLVRMADHKILGAWVARQRHQNREGCLDSGRKKLLDDVGFCWQARDKPGSKLRKDSSETVQLTTGPGKLAVERPVEGEAKPSSAGNGEAKYPVGTPLSKFFEGRGWCMGDVTSFDGELYMITYEDGDNEQLNEEDLEKFILANSQASEVEIGSRVTVERPGGGRFYKGMVTKRRSAQDSWYIVYDDLSWEWLDLRTRRFHLLPDHECHPRNKEANVGSRKETDSSLASNVQIGSRISVQRSEDG